MKYSRRKFMKTGVLAAACAGLPLKFALAQQNGTAGTSFAAQAADPSASSLSSINQLGYYSKEAFLPYVNTRFRVYLGASNTRSITLTGVVDNLTNLAQVDAGAKALGTECFSLLFTFPPSKPFAQDTYMIEHEALGTFYMFLVPVSQHDKKSLDYYEAVIYRRPQAAQELRNPAVITETEPVPAAPVAQPARNPWRVNDAQGERDIYTFSSLVIAPAAEDQAKNRPAPVQATWLSKSQDQGINGLKLGMTADQVLALFPGSRDDEAVRADLSAPASQLGLSTLRISPQKYSSKSEFKGIGQIVLTMLDGRVSTLYVGYDAPQAAQVDEFVTKFSKGRKLPPAESWEPYAGLDDQLKTMKCKDFEIDVFAGGKNVDANYVQLVDTVAQQKLKARRAEARKKRGR